MPLLSAETLYTGRIFRLDRDTVRFPDGSVAPFDIIRHPGAAAVVPFLDDPGAPDPRIVLIRQFRHAAGGEIWEIPAGRLEPGEDPATCARRELEEETGYTAGRVDHLLSLYTTPGFTDELIHLYAATEIRPGMAHREADEFMQLHQLRWSEVGEMMATGQIQDAKTLVTLMWVQCFRMA
ncbi:MAG: NUDIX hydrolase [Gemmatimonadales bacterium]